MTNEIDTYRYTYVIQVTGLFKLLGDDARLRLLRLLRRERLNVSELTTILGIAQSGVSRHLGLLREARLVAEERAGGYSYYHAEPLDGAERSVWAFLNETLDAAQDDDDEVIRGDDARLAEVLRQRSERRDAHGIAPGEAARQLVPGRSWAAWSRALGLLLPSLRVADLGCGDGHLTLELAAWASAVVAVDRSAEVLEAARRLARRRGAANIEWHQGEIDALPLEDASVDVALLSQALHHAREPGAALGEAARVVVPGGRVLVLDLARHDESWVREQLGDRWNGFAREELADLLGEAGLTEVTVRSGLDAAPFAVLIGAGVKAGGKAGVTDR